MYNMSQGIYSPLPQSISDSDSEEELHNTTQIQSKTNDNNKLINGNDLCDIEDSHTNGFPNFNSIMDNATVIKNGYKAPMTPVRKFFFSISILLCFLTIVVFLWVLPCSDDATCPAVSVGPRMSSWEKPYHGIELMGPVNVIRGINAQNKNLVFLFRNALINDGMSGLQNVLTKNGGVISIDGENGKVAWYASRDRLPLDLDCTLLDIDNDGRSDCIVSGESGLLESINPLTGVVQWCVHIHNNTKTVITSIDFPLVISDIDNDGINDLLSSCSLNNSNHNLLAIISGYSGKIIGKPYEISKCDLIQNLKVDQSYVSFSCRIGLDNKPSSLTLHDFYSKVFNRTITQHNLITNQHARFKFDENQRMIYSVNGRQLVVNNQGRCPGNCKVMIQLIDERFNHGRNTTWTYTGSNMYGMVPTSLTFNSSSETNVNALQGHVNGFILKFWQWNTKRDPSNFESPKFQKRNLIAWYLPTVRIKHNVPLDSIRNISTVEQSLTERIVLITFNSTNYNIVNVSQSEITQLCIQENGLVYYQPQLSYQQNSGLIVDLDGDGSKELVTYSSTYLDAADVLDSTSKYQLQSSIKVIRLEAELPKLYEAVTKY